MLREGGGCLVDPMGAPPPPFALLQLRLEQMISQGWSFKLECYYCKRNYR